MTDTSNAAEVTRQAELLVPGIVARIRQADAEQKALNFEELVATVAAEHPHVDQLTGVPHFVFCLVGECLVEHLRDQANNHKEHADEMKRYLVERQAQAKQS